MRSIRHFGPRADVRFGWWRASLAWANLVWAICFLILPGCGGGSDDLSRVSGTVSYQGSPLDHGSLRFFGGNGRPIGCVIQEDGSYEIDLPPGDFQVSVSLPPKMPANGRMGDTPPRSGPNALPEMYAQPITSGLSFSVGPQSGPLTYEIDLKRPTRRSRR
jgi:hypothetical protein